MSAAVTHFSLKTAALHPFTCDGVFCACIDAGAKRMQALLLHGSQRSQHAGVRKLPPESAQQAAGDPPAGDDCSGGTRGQGQARGQKAQSASEAGSQQRRRVLEEVGVEGTAVVLLVGGVAVVAGGAVGVGTVAGGAIAAKEQHCQRV